MGWRLCYLESSYSAGVVTLGKCLDFLWQVWLIRRKQRTNWQSSFVFSCKSIDMETLLLSAGGVQLCQKQLRQQLC